jgi:hypothetical protein
MKKIIKLSLFIIAIITASCTSDTTTTNTEAKDTVQNEVTNYDTLFYNASTGYIILKDKRVSSLGGASSVDATKAASLVKHSIDNSPKGVLLTPYFIDFDTQDFLNILASAGYTSTANQTTEKNVRLYFAAYNNSVAEHKKNYRTIIATSLVGNAEKDPSMQKYYNLGSLCPPECAGSENPPSDIPDSGCKLYYLAKSIK